MWTVHEFCTTQSLVAVYRTGHVIHHVHVGSKIKIYILHEFSSQISDSSCRSMSQNCETVNKILLCVSNTRVDLPPSAVALMNRMQSEHYTIFYERFQT